MWSCGQGDGVGEETSSKVSWGGRLSKRTLKPKVQDPASIKKNLSRIATDYSVM